MSMYIFTAGEESCLGGGQGGEKGGQAAEGGQQAAQAHRDQG